VIDQNPYQTPEAELRSIGGNSRINVFKRFSAWGVFGLSVITFGIYPIYWMYSRSMVVNENFDNKINSGWLIGLIIVAILSFTSEFFLGQNQSSQILSLLITVAYMVVYLVVLFSLRNRLEEIISDSGSAFNVSIGGVMTFFFNAIYLQYKINEAIDNNSGANS